MRSIIYRVPPGFRRPLLLVGLLLLALFATVPFAMPFASGSPVLARTLNISPTASGKMQNTPPSLTPTTPSSQGTPAPKSGSPQVKPTPTRSGTPLPRPTLPPRPTLTPTHALKPTPTSLPTPTPTPKPGWKPILQQVAPDCNNPSGVVWGVPSSAATGITCTGSGTLVRQLTSTRFAEVDLNAVNGTYDQNTFRLVLQESFPAPIDGSTLASVILRTPINGCGGYIFTLAPSGQWQLQNIMSCTNIPTVVSGTVSINPSQPNTLVFVGQNGTLSASINGTAVLSSYPDGSNVINGEVGLIVERPGGTSSNVEYANFELDMWR